MITTLLAIKKASARATHEQRINVYCLDRKMRSRQHDAYPEETLETRGRRCAKIWFVMNVIVVYLDNPRYIFIVRRLSNVGIIPTVHESSSI
jgi:hypothetical protein